MMLDNVTVRLATLGWTGHNLLLEDDLGKMQFSMTTLNCKHSLTHPDIYYAFIIYVEFQNKMCGNFWKTPSANQDEI